MNAAADRWVIRPYEASASHYRCPERTTMKQAKATTIFPIITEEGNHDLNQYHPPPIDIDPGPD